MFFEVKFFEKYIIKKGLNIIFQNFIRDPSYRMANLKFGWISQNNAVKKIFYKFDQDNFFYDEIC